jgi:hypothetical protein
MVMNYMLQHIHKNYIHEDDTADIDTLCINRQTKCVLINGI